MPPRHPHSSHEDSSDVPHRLQRPSGPADPDRRCLGHHQHHSKLRFQWEEAALDAVGHLSPVARPDPLVLPRPARRPQLGAGPLVRMYKPSATDNESDAASAPGDGNIARVSQTQQCRGGFMKFRFIGTLLLLLATALPAAAAELAGRWTAEFDSPIGVQKYIYVFKKDGAAVTGEATY